MWLARRHLPLPIGALYVAGFALRTLPVLRSRPRARAALRGYRDGLRGPCGERSRLRAQTLWRMTRAGRPPIIVAASLLLPDDRPVTDPNAAAEPEHTDEFNAVRHVYEPHSIGLPPLRPYVRELWRRREFAFEMARTSLRAQHFDTVVGQLWLVLNPLLLACVYFLLVDIIGAAHRRHLVLRPPDGDAVRLPLRDRRDPPGRPLGHRRRPADPQHGVPAHRCCRSRR